MLLAIMGFVFVAYLVIGLALPVLPLYVRNDLGLSPFMVGLVAGSPFVAALLTRLPAGRYADRRGGKRSVIVGLLIAGAGGVLYLVSLRVAGGSNVALAILLAGRALLGAADSFVITGALSWGLGLIGTLPTGKVVAWIGTAIYAAFAVGAPAGTALYAAGGFTAISLATVLIPLGALAVIVPLRSASAKNEQQPAAMGSVARAVWMPGLGLALGGVGFGAVTAFIVLLFAEHQWAPAWPAFTALSVAFVVGRLFFGTLADRLGGARVAFVCVLIEAVGLVLIWLAPSMTIALAGVTLSGFGYSLIYPSLGVEVIRRAPAQSRGLAMGAYTAFLDLSLGISSPLLGLMANGGGIASLFLVSALVVLCAAVVSLGLARPSRARSHADGQPRASRPTAL
jgi:MFS family permease